MQGASGEGAAPPGSKPGRPALRTCVSHRYANGNQPVLKGLFGEENRIGQALSPVLDTGSSGIGRRIGLDLSWAGRAKARLEKDKYRRFQILRPIPIQFARGARSPVLGVFNATGPQSTLVVPTPGAAGPAMPTPLASKTLPSNQLRTPQPEATN